MKKKGPYTVKSDEVIDFVQIVFGTRHFLTTLEHIGRVDKNVFGKRTDSRKSLRDNSTVTFPL